MSNTLAKNQKIIFSAICYLTAFAFGSSSGMLTSSMEDIAENVHREFKEVSRATSAQAAAVAIGFLIWGKVLSVMDRRPSMIFSFFVLIGTMLMFPFISSLILVWIAYIIFGFFGSLFLLASNAWILQIWKDKSNPVMQGLYFGASLSMAISPLIIAPYLSKKPEKHDNTTTTEIQRSHEISMKSTGEDGHLPSLLIPYLFPAASFTICAIAYIIVYFDKRYSETGESDKDFARKTSKAPNFGETAEPNEETQLSNSAKSRNSLVTIGLAILVCVLNQCNECNTMTFTTPFVSFLVGNKEQGAHTSSLLAASNAVGRLASVVTARYLAPQFMVMGHLLVIIAGNVLLLTLASTWHTIIPIAFVLIGVGQSSVFPSLLSLYNQEIHMTSQLLSTILLADSAALVITPQVVSPFLESFPLIFPIFNLIVISACFAALLVFYMNTRNIKLAKTGENNNNIHH